MNESDAYMCPYPGPRPLRRVTDGRHPWRFVGREGQIDDIVKACSNNAHVLVYGLSGCGKSSLLDMGVVPRLRAYGKVVVWLSNWSALGDDFDAFLREQLKSVPWMPKEVKEVLKECEDRSPVQVLDDAWPGRVVFVLDQFEELMRGNQGGYDSARRFVETLSSDHFRHVTTLVSLRAEYYHRVKEMHTAPGSTIHLEVTAELSEQEIIQAVRLIGAPIGDPICRPAMNEAAAKWFARAWCSTRWRGKSVLDLQAVLFELWHQGEDRNKVKEMSPGEVQRALKASSDLEYFFPAEDALHDIYGSVIERKLQAVRMQFEERNPERKVLGHAAYAFVNNIVTRLSSGGYKLDLQAWDVFRDVCRWEIEAIRTLTSSGDAGDKGEGVGPRNLEDLWLDRLGAWLGRLLNSSISIDIAPPGVWHESGLGATPQRQRVGQAFREAGAPCAPWIDDPHSLTGGPLLGASPGLMLAEQVRAFALALRWLSEAHFVSLVRRGEGGRGWTLSLVHDRMGDPIISWAVQSIDNPLAVIWSCRAWVGQRWDWRPWIRKDGVRFPPVVVGARWMRCEIAASFSDMVFLNCDFRGSRFRDCIFQGVTFVNCLLDDASFESCGFLDDPSIGEMGGMGASGLSPMLVPGVAVKGKGLRLLPSYEVLVDPILVSEWIWYIAEKGNVLPDDGVGRFTSLMAGLPAWPKRPLSTSLDAAPEGWAKATAGVRIYGGRVNSLTMQACRFDQRSSLSIVRAAGSSLDLVEMQDVRLNLLQCAVRGLAITSPLVVDYGESTTKVTINILDCALIDTWFGSGLNGKVIIDESQVVNFVNMSKELEVYILDCSMAATAGVLAVMPADRGPDDLPRPVRELREAHEARGKRYEGPLSLDIGELVESRPEVQGMLLEARKLFQENADKVTFRAVPAEYDVAVRLGVVD